MKNRAMALIPMLFWMVTWSQQTTKYNDCSWTSNGMVSLAVMCYPGCSLTEEKRTEEYEDKAQAKERINALQSDRNASEIKLYEYREVK